MKLRKILLLSVLVLTLALVFTACGKEEQKTNPEPTTKNEVPSNDPTLTLAETNVYEVQESDNKFNISLTVDNATELLYLYQYVEVKDGVEWLLSTDIEATGDAIIASKTVQLEEGENTYYILCTGENDLFEIYTLTIYRRHMYTVTFENLTETQQVEEGGMATTPTANPQKTGYTFVSWSFNFTNPITEDTAVKANWKANTYTVTFDANGGYVAPETQTVTFGSEVTLPVPTRNGYDFAGWQSGSITYTDGIWETASNVKLTAIWDYSAFTVTLNPDGGTLDETEVEVRYGASYQLPTPNRDGYVFKGWYNGEELFDSTGIWSRLAGLSLTAKWEVSDMVSISCTMIANGGTVLPQTQLLPVGSALPIPTRSGYTFGGWFADDALTVEITAITEDLIDQYGSNLRLYAWWKEEGKPGEFIYELQGIYCVVTGYKVDAEPYPEIPGYIGGRAVKVDIKPPVDPNAGITVNPEITLTVGDAAVIYATFIPAYATDSKVLYFSTDSDCIHLGTTGAVTALKPGTAVVTIRNEDGNYTATCVLTILGRPNKNPGITVSQSEVTLEEGKQTEIEVTFVPDREGDNTELSYIVSSDCIKLEDGVLTAVKPGSAIITVKNADGKYSISILVTVTERIPDPSAGIALETDAITLEEGQSGKINATVTPAFPEDSTDLIFATESDCILLDSEGNFTAEKAGTAIVKVSTSAGLTAFVTITVTAKPEPEPVPNPDAGLTVDCMSANLYVGDVLDIVYTYVPAFEGDDLTVTATLDTEDIVSATVQEGTVHLEALTQGEATLTLSAADGKYTAVITLSVSAAVVDEDTDADVPNEEIGE